MLTVGHNKLFCVHAVLQKIYKNPACFSLVSVFPHIPDSYYVERSFFVFFCDSMSFFCVLNFHVVPPLQLNFVRLWLTWSNRSSESHSSHTINVIQEPH